MFAILTFLFYGVRNYNYWRKRGIKYNLPLPYFGNNIKQFTLKASIAAVATEMYNSYPEEKAVGFYRGTTPELILKDPEMIKRVLVTDFHSFYAKGINPHKTVIEPLLKNLFFADGDLWHLLRQRFTPAFSTAKLKAMFPLITERAEKLQIVTEEMSTKEHCDVCELMASYSTDCIGACGFGIDIDCISRENSEFRKLGKSIFERDLRDCIVAFLKYTCPEMFKNLTFLNPKIQKSMENLIHLVMKARNFKPSGRNDFIDIMLELKQKGNIIGDSMEKKDVKGYPDIVNIEITDLLIVAQTFLFFGAGFETTSTATSYTLHQLAYNPEYQDIVHNEIDKVLAKNGNKITYEAMKEMKYLKMAFYEAMRMFPSVGFIIRTCTVPEYTFPEINLTINKDVKIMIPVQALQRDKRYFDKPEVFHPKRFENGLSDEKYKFVFLPFGEGPRACVGEQFLTMYYYNTYLVSLI